MRLMAKLKNHVRSMLLSRTAMLRSLLLVTRTVVGKMLPLVWGI